MRPLATILPVALLTSPGCDGRPSHAEAAAGAFASRALPCATIEPSLASIGERIAARLDEAPSVPVAIHYLRAGDALGIPEARRLEAVSMLLGTSEFSPIVRTRTGLRFQSRAPKTDSPGPFAESHFAQAVSELLLQGIRADYRVELDGGEGTFGELVADLESNYWPKRFELEWTALALVEAVPPRRSWTTRHGETFDFDGLAGELLDRTAGVHSCSNLHLVEALAQLQVRDREHGLLGAGERTRVTQFLGATAEAFLEHQHDRGWWPPSWDRGPASGAPSPQKADVLATTSHVLELTAVYPSLDRGVDREAARRWLTDALVAACGDGEFVASHYCAVTHAFRAIHLQP